MMLQTKLFPLFLCLAYFHWSKSCYASSFCRICTCIKKLYLGTDNPQGTRKMDLQSSFFLPDFLHTSEVTQNHKSTSWCSQHANTVKNPGVTEIPRGTTFHMIVASTYPTSNPQKQVTKPANSSSCSCRMHSLQGECPSLPGQGMSQRKDSPPYSVPRWLQLPLDSWANR